MKGKKQNRGFGCAKFFVVLLTLALLVAILLSSGVLKEIRTKVERQLYPLKYEDVILSASDEYNLEPEFICAVIHTESKFETEAQSHAGAQGLMQIMPDTFSWLTDYRDKEHEPEDINDPAVNIDYGTFYLRYLTDKYGDEYTAAAAYNAGNVVDDWLLDPACSSDGVTLHSIPYPETSEYVERIQFAESMYQKLYFDE